MITLNSLALYVIGTTFMLTLILLYIYFSKGRPLYLLLWCTSFFMFSVHVTLRIIYLEEAGVIYLKANKFMLFASAVLLLWSITVYLDDLRPKRYYVWMLLLGLVTSALFAGAEAFKFIMYIFVIIIYLTSVFRLIKKGNNNAGQKVILLTLVLLLANSLEHLLVLNLISKISFLFYGLIMGVFGIGGVVKFFEKEKRVLKNNLEHTVLALATAVEAKDIYTLNHSQQVANLATEIAKKMGLSSPGVEQIYFAGLLHDIGKIGVSDYILQKPDKLSKVELEELKMHAETGCRILEAAGGYFTSLIPLVRHHHERWDGNGYPHGLKGEEIPLGAAILAVADAYDAMVSNRSYRNALLEANALEEIKKEAGSQFHPQVANVFLEYFQVIKEQVEAESLVMLQATGGKNLPGIYWENINTKTYNKTELAQVLRPFDYQVKYKGILNATVNIILILSREFNILEWNSKAEEVYGYGADELKHLYFSRLQAPLGASELEEHFQSAKDTVFLSFETEHKRKDGSIFPVEMKVSVFTQSGQPCWLVVIRDISNRKQREQEIKQLEQKYLSLFEGVRDALVVYDLNLNILEVNGAACEQLGYIKKELLSMNLLDIQTVESGAVNISNLTTIKEKRQLLFKGEYLTKEGRIIPMEINAMLINFVGGEAVLTVCQNSIYRKNTESLASKILDAIPHSAYLIDAKRKIVAANKAARKFEAFSGENCYHTIFGRKKVCLHCEADKALQINETHTGELKICGQKHMGYWIPLEDGLFLHYFVDITAQIKINGRL